MFPLLCYYISGNALISIAVFLSVRKKQSFTSLSTRRKVLRFIDVLLFGAIILLIVILFPAKESK